MALVKFEDWLNRKPAGPKPRKPLTRTQVRRVSKKQSKALKNYLTVRAKYLGEHPRCEAGPVILGAKLPAHYCVPRCGGWSKEVHHTAGRGTNLCNTETFCATCRNCHKFVHAHPQWSRTVGLLLK